MSTSKYAGPRWVARRLADRGQAGLTMIELIIVVGVGTLLAVPSFVLMNQVFRSSSNSVTSNDTSQQLRVFRAVLAKDWAEAQTVKVGIGTWMDTECNQGNRSSFFDDVDGPHIAIHAIPIGGSSTPRRIIYNTRQRNDGRGIDIIRRECEHLWHGSDPNAWAQGGSVNAAPVGSQRIVVERVRSLNIPATCNTFDQWPKPPPQPAFERCDMNITVIGRDDTIANPQRATLRLRQNIGRDS